MVFTSFVTLGFYESPDKKGFQKNHRASKRVFTGMLQNPQDFHTDLTNPRVSTRVTTRGLMKMLLLHSASQ